MKYIQKDYKSYIMDMEFKDYSIIDPPWSYDDKPPALLNNQLTYTLWNDNYNDLKFIFENIKTNYIFLWTTNSLLDVVFKSFLDNKNKQFVYKSCLTWNKLTENGSLFYGLGNTFRNSTELLLVFQNNECKPLRLDFRTSILEKCGKRTVKPKKFESDLINELNKRNFKGCYIFSGYNISNLDIECIDIFDKNELNIYNIKNELEFN